MRKNCSWLDNSNKPPPNNKRWGKLPLRQHQVRQATAGRVLAAFLMADASAVNVARQSQHLPQLMGGRALAEQIIRDVFVASVALPVQKAVIGHVPVAQQTKDVSAVNVVHKERKLYTR